ncbi:hypothetical protein PANA5342_2447 [Pantoea ananatis LMG 5342]|nr:hypothetical protein PANA5342_2447 [Pantoea ananatis LMG 5342]
MLHFLSDKEREDFRNGRCRNGKPVGSGSVPGRHQHTAI